MFRKEKMSEETNNETVEREFTDLDKSKGHLLRQIVDVINYFKSSEVNSIIEGFFKTKVNVDVFAKYCGEALAIPYKSLEQVKYPDENNLVFTLSAVLAAENDTEDLILLEFRKLHEIALHFMYEQSKLFLYNQQLKNQFLTGVKDVDYLKCVDPVYHTLVRIYENIFELYENLLSCGYIREGRGYIFAFFIMLWMKANELIDVKIDSYQVLTQEIDYSEYATERQAVKMMYKKNLSVDTISMYIAMVYYRQHVGWHPLISLYEMKRDQVDHLVQILQREEYVDKLKSSAKDGNDTMYNIGRAITIEDTDSMTADMFEKLIAALYIKQGYEAYQTQFVGDQGVDVIAKKSEAVIAIQAKCYNSPVGNSAVQEVVAGKSLYNATESMVITNNTFTPQARKLAESNNVALCDRNMLKAYLLSFPVVHMDLMQVETK